jgi:predicted O-methyltransferase YrrM
VLDTYHVMIRREREQMVPGESHDHKLLAVGPDTGQLINVLARSLKKPTILELGTSFGYSGIWLGAAAHARGGRVITMEKQAYKSEFARDMAAKAGLADTIDFRVGDAVQMIDELDAGLDFVLVDLWKDLYVPCLEAFYPKLKPGAIIVADNMLMPGNEHVRQYGRAIRGKPGIASVLLPVGQGVEVSRFDPH